MCIICNMGTSDAAFAAQSYCYHYDTAVAAMKQAEAKMLECSKVATSPEVRKRYDTTHKAMVRTRKEWASLQHTREAPATASEVSIHG